MYFHRQLVFFCIAINFITQFWPLFKILNSFYANQHCLHVTFWEKNQYSLLEFLPNHQQVFRGASWGPVTNFSLKGDTSQTWHDVSTQQQVCNWLLKYCVLRFIKENASKKKAFCYSKEERQLRDSHYPRKEKKTKTNSSRTEDEVSRALKKTAKRIQERFNCGPGGKN